MLTETWQWMVVIGECFILAVVPIIFIVARINKRRRA
jgi:hypothetical protein